MDTLPRQFAKLDLLPMKKNKKYRLLRGDLVEEDKALHEGRRPIWLRSYAGLIITLVAIFLWVTFAFSPRPEFLYEFELRSDRFNAFEALMSALALAGLVYTLAVQQFELRMQQVELRLTREQTVQQTEIFRTENFERRFFQALEQFRDFQREVAFEGRKEDIELSETLDIPLKIKEGQNKGMELAGTLARICVSKVMLVSGDKQDVERKQLLTNLVSFYGGAVHPLIKRVRLLLKQIEQRRSELQLSVTVGVLSPQELERRTEQSRREVEYYSALLRDELKPDQHALIAMCALYRTPYDDLGALVRSTSFLDDFNWLWADVLLHGTGGSYLKCDPLTLEAGQTLKDMGLRVVTQNPSAHATSL